MKSYNDKNALFNMTRERDVYRAALRELADFDRQASDDGYHVAADVRKIAQAALDSPMVTP